MTGRSKINGPALRVLILKRLCAEDFVSFADLIKLAREAGATEKLRLSVITSMGDLIVQEYREVVTGRVLSPGEVLAVMHSQYAAKTLSTEDWLAWNAAHTLGWRLRETHAVAA